MRAVFDAARPAVEECGAGAVRRAETGMVIAGPTGRPEQVTVETDPPELTAIQNCIAAVVRGLQFPAFSRRSLPVTYDYRLEVAAPPAPPPAPPPSDAELEAQLRAAIDAAPSTFWAQNVRTDVENAFGPCDPDVSEAPRILAIDRSAPGTTVALVDVPLVAEHQQEAEGAYGYYGWDCMTGYGYLRNSPFDCEGYAIVRAQLLPDGGLQVHGEPRCPVLEGLAEPARWQWFDVDGDGRAMEVLATETASPIVAFEGTMMEWDCEVPRARAAILLYPECAPLLELELLSVGAQICPAWSGESVLCEEERAENARAHNVPVVARRIEVAAGAPAKVTVTTCTYSFTGELDEFPGADGCDWSGSSVVRTSYGQQNGRLVPEFEPSAYDPNR